MKYLKCKILSAAFCTCFAESKVIPNTVTIKSRHPFVTKFYTRLVHIRWSVRLFRNAEKAQQNSICLTSKTKKFTSFSICWIFRSKILRAKGWFWFICQILCDFYKIDCIVSSYLSQVWNICLPTSVFGIVTGVREWLKLKQISQRLYGIDILR